MWAEGWRQRFWNDLDRAWDVLVIGGGITGAGIALEAARAGLTVCLVEQNDFASGTSSGSSKLVHGGLRYLAGGNWRLTRESVRERQALLRGAPGLVEPLDFIMPTYRGDRPGRMSLWAGLAAYDMMAGKRYSHTLGTADMQWHMPYLRKENLRGGFVYRDALTDDARLTLRVLGEAVGDGAVAANYVRAESLVFDNDRVAGAQLVDCISGDTGTLRARCVINATGPWTDRLRASVEAPARLRPLRGSHFVFEFASLPVARAITLFHPDDKRPLFAVPWQGTTLFGTTDLDHDAPMDERPRMSAAESDYLMQAARHYFAPLDLCAAHAVASYAGVRPVVAGGAGVSASKESRESAIWEEKGLISVTGGKLTTFRVTAHEVLARVATALGRPIKRDLKAPVFAPLVTPLAGGSKTVHRYGAAYAAMAAAPNDDMPIGGSVYTRAELRFALENEAVEHLDDLMLRRTRLGLLLPEGGAEELPLIGRLCRDALDWDDARWAAEQARYLRHWQAVHSPV